jgi:hypothetical protein
MREAQRCPLFGRDQGKTDVARTSRFVDSEAMRGGRCKKWRDTAEKLGERLGGSARLLYAALRPRTQSAVADVLLRQKSICDNQSHHARENQQCREGFSDHWPRRMARGR